MTEPIVGIGPPPDAPLVVGVDDSLLRKTGRGMAGTVWRRDPLGAAFRVQFAWAQRALQFSTARPMGAEGTLRLVPVDFVHAPTPDKPRKGADVAIQAAYVAAAKEANLVALARQRRAGVRIPQTRHSVRSFSAQFARRSGGPARLCAMGFASAPTAWRIAGRKNVENARPTTGVY